jgi:hypothetical protein
MFFGQESQKRERWRGNTFWKVVTHMGSFQQSEMGRHSKKNYQNIGWECLMCVHKEKGKKASSKRNRVRADNEWGHFSACTSSAVAVFMQFKYLLCRGKSACLCIGCFWGTPRTLGTVAASVEGSSMAGVMVESDLLFSQFLNIFWFCCHVNLLSISPSVTWKYFFTTGKIWP